MDDLIAFLKARLDEDEQIAGRVKAKWRQDGNTGVIVASDGRHAEPCAQAHWTGVAEHIVRHDPPRVLREVEAKRRKIRLCEYMLTWNADHDTGVTEHEIQAMRTAGGEMLRLLALPYADHPDYLEAWRP